MAQAFEWDEVKRQINVRKHRIDFPLAATIFFGEIVEEIDDREDYGEERNVALGLASGTVLRVTYTRRGNAIRIISAQRASKHDQNIYYRSVYGR